MSSDPLADKLIYNAIDFLLKAIENFKTQPKYSVINFYSAVELFLKARLIREHWSLTVSKDPDRAKFVLGDFVSVTFEQACERLEKVIQSPVPPEARKNFDAVRKHRNKMVHFFHEGDATSDKAILENVAEEQLRAWSSLHLLLTSQWRDIFSAHYSMFAEIERKLKGHRDYLKAKFDLLAPKIGADKVKGIDFGSCGACGFEAARKTSIVGDLSEVNCLVCGYKERRMDFACPDCGNISFIREGEEFSCTGCDKKLSEDELADELNEFFATPDNYLDAQVPANCGDCDGFETVVEYKDKYLCVRCFAVTDGLEACGWCGAFSSGDMENSYMTGCGYCDGNVGWHSDKDD
jgi:hypothetical protein